ncbi:polynucleotidyl transferase, ribonuclease H-like superfamily protein [Artemisia annua]|uniref:Polynucleotidyl transferase, ribonuclease H-like superfamily protein n=1 Tax=Artemisia annua TaxID=35608 RepID=A0A2U1KB22_ARTAN|nr:polynucleotidyl transferase, ribonuclease H-like superfamily protein [Artemisia annua]
MARYKALPCESQRDALAISTSLFQKYIGCENKWKCMNQISNMLRVTLQLLYNSKPTCSESEDSTIKVLTPKLTETAATATAVSYGLKACTRISRLPPEPKGTIDTLVLLTQRYGRRAGNMKGCIDGSWVKKYGSLGYLSKQKHNKVTEISGAKRLMGRRFSNP